MAVPKQTEGRTATWTRRATVALRLPKDGCELYAVGFEWFGMTTNPATSH